MSEIPWERDNFKRYQDLLGRVEWSQLFMLSCSLLFLSDYNYFSCLYGSSQKPWNIALLCSVHVYWTITWLTYKNVATFSPRFKTQVCCRNNYQGLINGSSEWSIRIGISSSQSWYIGLFIKILPNHLNLDKTFKHVIYVNRISHLTCMVCLNHSRSTLQLVTNKFWL